MKISIAVTLLSIIFFSSCKKEIAGPKGDTGDIGNTGLQGANGLSNQKIYYGKDWTGCLAGDSGTSGYIWTSSCVLFPTYFSLPAINLDSSTVIMYLDSDTSNITTAWSPLPYTENGITINFIMLQQDPREPMLIYTKYDGTSFPRPGKNYDLKMSVISN